MAGNTWLDYSEITAGLVLDRKLNPELVNCDLLHPPYDQVVTDFKAGKDITNLIDSVGLSTVTTATEAARQVTSKLPIEWLRLLTKSAGRASAAKMFKREISKLERGEDADVTRLMEAIEAMDRQYVTFRTADQIDPSAGIWQPTFYNPLDAHTGPPEDPSIPGGIPVGGLVVVGAPPGTGKTSFGAKLLTCAAKAGKKVAMWSLEMLDSQIVYRMIQIGDLTMEERKNIYVVQGKRTADEVYSEATRLAALEPELYFIVVDFADLMVLGETTEQTMGYVYSKMQELSIRTGVAVILLSQLNRENYRGGIPRINHLRYSGMAEALGAMVMLLYNPRQIFVAIQKDDTLPLIDGRAWIIVGKSRFGFREGGPGAISVDWDGQTAWGDTDFGYHSLNSV